MRASETDYTIRRATPGDSAAINDLCVAAYREFEAVVGAANWQQMRETLSRAADLSSLGEFILAEDATGLLGVVLYVPPGKSDGHNTPRERASIRMLAVSPGGRGRGIGRRLTQECIDRASRDGAGAIGLATAEIMRVARPMYERMGFKKEAELGTRFGVEQARYVLTLKQPG
jgi:ribosomal protein S18 acetylase RimI-like enzyme